jgi:hypothetical protein
MNAQVLSQISIPQAEYCKRKKRTRREVFLETTKRGLLMTQGALVDASLITAPSSTKSKDHARDPEMHEAKNDAQLNVMFLVQYCFKLEYL